MPFFQNLFWRICLNARRATHRDGRPVRCRPTARHVLYDSLDGRARRSSYIRRDLYREWRLQSRWILRRCVQTKRPVKPVEHALIRALLQDQRSSSRSAYSSSRDKRFFAASGARYDRIPVFTAPKMIHGPPRETHATRTHARLANACHGRPHPTVTSLIFMLPFQVNLITAHTLLR